MYYAATIYDQVYKYLSREKGTELENANIDFRLSDKDLGVNTKVNALISGEFDKSISQAFPNVKVIIVPYTGMNRLDKNLVESKRIRVFNSTAHSHFVAERALALTLAVLGKIVFYHNNLKVGDWSGRTGSDRVYWTSLTKKRVAIYGYGIIGKEIHRLMKPFGIEVGVVDHRNRRHPDVHVFKRVEELALWSDVFIVSAPLNSETEGRINEAVLTALKDSVLINIARGGLINEEALYNALENNVLKGFASDVWYNYPAKDKKIVLPSNYPLERFENVVMTPHCGGFEETSIELRYNDVADQLIRISTGDFSGEKHL